MVRVVHLGTGNHIDSVHFCSKCQDLEVSIETNSIDNLIWHRYSRRRPNHQFVQSQPVIRHFFYEKFFRTRCVSVHAFG